MEKLELKQKREFFAKSCEEQLQGGYCCKTLRSVLLNRLVSEKVEEREVAVHSEELPLGVWQQRGWEKTAVESCPFRDDQKLGRLYSVPVRMDTLREVHRHLEEQVAELERLLAKDKKRKAEEVAEQLELEVGEEAACAKASAKSKSKKAKTSAEEPKGKAGAQQALNKEKSKADKNNQKLADLAAKTLVVVTGFLKAAPSLQQQLRKLDLSDEADKLQAAEKEAGSWRKSSSDLLALHESSKGTGVPLSNLGYTTADLKERQKLWNQLLRTYRQDVKNKKLELGLLKPAAKDKAAKGKAAAGGA